MASLLKVKQWVRQDSSNYRFSTAWVNWEVDSSLPNVHILSKGDAIFDKCQIKEILPAGIVFPLFKWEGIKMPKVMHANFHCHHYDDVPLSDLVDITQHYSGPVFRIEPQSKQVFVKLFFESNDSTDKVKYFDVDFEVCIEVVSLDSYISYQTDDDGHLKSFAIDHVFSQNIYRLALLYADGKLDSQRKSTPFKGCTLDKLAKDDRLLSNAYYLVPMGNGYYRPIKDNQIHGVAYCY